MNRGHYQQAVPIMEDEIPVATLADEQDVDFYETDVELLNEGLAYSHTLVRALPVDDEEGDTHTHDHEETLLVDHCLAREPILVDVDNTQVTDLELDQDLLAHTERTPQQNDNDPFVLHGRIAESLSSYLNDMIREGYECRSVPRESIRNEHSCNQVVERCMTYPDEAFYLSRNGRTPLHEACLRGSCGHVISILLQKNPMGASLQDSRGNTPLHLLFVDQTTTRIIRISEYGGYDIAWAINSLLEVSPIHSVSYTNSEGNTALHMACLAPERMVPPSAIEQLLQANVHAASIVNNHNQPPLLLHCKRKNASIQTARLLYNAYPEALSTLSSDDGWAALHYVASDKNLGLLKFFLEQTNPNSARLKTRSGETVLHLMCKQNLAVGQLPALEVLLRAYPGAVIQRENQRLRTPLHSLLCHAGSRTSLEVVKGILIANPSVVDISDDDQYLPIHHACENGCEPSIVAAILEMNPSAAYAMTRRQDSALSLACACNMHEETVRMLIQANIDAVTRKNDYGFAPLHCVCRAHQPRMGIIQTLMDASPNCIALQTHGGETPVHLVSGNASALVGVLQLLTQHQRFHSVGDITPGLPAEILSTITNKVGNTPLHDACFRGASFEHVETLAMAHPEWVRTHNNGGLSPFQILCKNGRIDERIVTFFSRIGGPEIFNVVDSTGNTALHSAMREDTDLPTLRCLIRALPESLQMKTVYGDSPLHLACLRRAHPDVVREVALASTTGQHCPAMEPNTRGQTPIGIALEDFQNIVCRSHRGSRSCCVLSEYSPEQLRVFDVLATLVKLLHYGAGMQDTKHMNLVRACVELHSRGVRLDPVFMRRAIHVNPEEVIMMDDDGTFPLHIESSIPVEKMSLLDGDCGCCDGECHKRIGILGILLNIYPSATKVRSILYGFPLNGMIKNGRPWQNEIAVALQAFPSALDWRRKGLGDPLLSLILAKVSRRCGVDTLFSLLLSFPDIVSNDRHETIH